LKYVHNRIERSVEQVIEDRIDRTITSCSDDEFMPRSHSMRTLAEHRVRMMVRK
jgi:hypothetical protein